MVVIWLLYGKPRARTIGHNLLGNIDDTLNRSSVDPHYSDDSEYNRHAPAGGTLAARGLQ